MKLKFFLLFIVFYSCKVFSIVIGSSLLEKDGSQCLLLDSIVSNVEPNPYFNDTIVEQFDAIKLLPDKKPNVKVFFEDVPAFFDFEPQKNILQLLTEHSLRPGSEKFIPSDKRSSIQYIRIIQLLRMLLEQDFNNELMRNLEVSSRNAEIATMGELKTKIILRFGDDHIRKDQLVNLFRCLNPDDVSGLSFRDFIHVTKNIPMGEVLVPIAFDMLQAVLADTIILSENRNPEFDEMDRFIVNQLEMHQSDAVVVACSCHIDKIKKYLISKGFANLKEVITKVASGRQRGSRRMSIVKPIRVSEIDF